MAIEITKPNLLVVEGREEELFFGAIVRDLGLQDIQVIGIGGKMNLRRNLRALTLSPCFTEVVSLGVVRDANDNPSAAFQSVHDALQAVNLPAPGRSLMPTGDVPQVTVMILPEEGMRGMLEDLCLKSVAKDSAMVCVTQYFECLQQRGLSLPENLSKATVQVFLASRRRAGLRLGEAAQAGYWLWDDDAFRQVRDFLQQIGS